MITMTKQLKFNLHYLRTKAGFTKKEMANKLNASRHQYDNWENHNTIKPKSNQLSQICRFYGISIDSILLTDLSILEGELV